MSESVGKKLFLTRCACCHSLDLGAKHKVGPNLFGIYNKRSCTSEGYTYSQGMKHKGPTWDEENLSKFLDDPRRTVPGTKMLFSGLKKPQEREDIIAFFRKISK
ncbi:cytochrome c-like [Leguminivora glycinivorella]|uniref:cytochrome c-like n=1 Tax=Leguminivora glycinivorella TaxID=1035111 RepID=UPI00200E3FBB|nr:cytochrome c-like [Leguminivora glycinivorella]